jgi:hypothetical protein
MEFGKAKLDQGQNGFVGEQNFLTQTSARETKLRPGSDIVVGC